jgi:murein DD-endopeptidase MepM/ murein hydrolase activator NlpD
MLSLVNFIPPYSRWFCVMTAVLAAFITLPNAQAQQRTVALPLADGFDYPVGKPDGKGYYVARGLRLRSPIHFGEDWNGLSGGDTDLGDPIWATADGIVMFSYNVQVGWGNIVIIRHAYRDPQTGQVRFCDSLYGHLLERMVKVGEIVKRGQQIGKMGSNSGMYPAHLHFEIRHNLTIGMQRESVARTMDNWADPRTFINRYRKLNREFRKQSTPIGTFTDYHGCKGL